MTKQYAKMTIEYIDYLIDLSDAQAFLTIMSKAERLVTKHDKHQDMYITMRDGGANVTICLPTKAEAGAPVYNRSEMD
jgi:hypothetical protein